MVITRMKIEPEEFTSVFNPTTCRKETYLLFEIKWDCSPKSYRGCCKNTFSDHAKINFLRNVFDRQHHKTSTKCVITWYLSWSPCGICAQAVAYFLEQNPNVTLEVYAARLYLTGDAFNRAGLRRLHRHGACVCIMGERDYRYCWRTFVDVQGEQFTLWPRTISMSFKFLCELYTVLYQEDFLERPTLNRMIPANHHLLLNERFWRTDAN